MPSEFFIIKSDKAKRVSHTLEKSEQGSFFMHPERKEVVLREGESIEQAVERIHTYLGQVQLEKSENLLGTYYPNVYRPVLDPHNSLKHPDFYDPHVIVALSEQISVMMRSLDDIFRIIHPAPPNFASYGHEIGNLLVLACTEMESHFRAILIANQIDPSSGSQGRYSTKDFVKLHKPLRLSEYQIALPKYPWLPAISPFEYWSDVSPTKSLDWYDAYNSVKHDRWNNFEKANLLHVMKSIVACAVVHCARFGSLPNTRNYTAFNWAAYPKWSNAEKYLLPHSSNWTDPKVWSPISISRLIS